MLAAIWLTGESGRAGPYCHFVGWGNVDLARMRLEYEYNMISFLTFAEAAKHVNAYWHDTDGQVHE